ncbi:MAG: RpiR family transcriptional regulator, partial [Acinetobacter sp.]|nr:RpiR family transcriptional regulator [Acinetobacter sp.]
TLDLFVNYRKNSQSLGVQKFIDQLTKVFHLDKNLNHA